MDCLSRQVSDDMRRILCVCLFGTVLQWVKINLTFYLLVLHLSILYSVYGSLREVEAGAKRLAQVILGASHLAQTCVPALLNPTDASIQQWKLKLRQTLEHQATFLCQELADCHGLDVMIPGGAMYALVHIDPTQMDEAIENDVDFSKLLLQEENVFVLPGVCFGVRDVFRVVYCAPVEILQQAAERIHQFCERHSSGI
jgi:tyrosine aminotransferase